MNEYLVSKLKEGRINKGLKQSDVTKFTGIKNTTLSNYENGITEPDIDTFLQLCEFYELDYAGILAEAYGLAVQGEEFKIKPSEIERIKIYRSLDDFGQETIDIALNREAKRVTSLKNLDKRIRELQSEPSSTSTQIRAISYYQRLASAGTGQIVFDGVPVDKIEILDIPEYKRVSYAIGVNGNSMEPLYHDGDILLIEPTCKVDIGEIGIFIIGDESYVKRLGEGKLISLNAEYKDIPLTEYSKCMGRVVDKISNHPDLSFKDMDALREGMISAKPQKKNA